MMYSLFYRMREVFEPPLFDNDERDLVLNKAAPNSTNILGVFAVDGNKSFHGPEINEESPSKNKRFVGSLVH
jgi:hypothetical protein